MYYVVDIQGALAIEFTKIDPIGVVLAGPLLTFEEAHSAYIDILAKDAESSPIIGH